jgi:integrase
MAKGPYLIRVVNSKYWYIREAGGGKHSTRETDRGLASAVLARYIDSKTAAKSTAGVTFGDVLNAYEEDRRTLNEKTYLNKWQYVIKRLRRRDGHRPLEEITTDWAKTYVKDRLEEVQEPTIRQELASVMAAWNVAIRNSITTIPVPVFALPAASDPRDDYLMRDEADRLIAAADKPHVRLFIRLALATAGRHEAILQLTWSQIDLEQNIVDLRRRAAPVPRKHRAGPKSAEPRQKLRGHVPISGAIVEELHEARARAVTDHVIEYRGQPIKSIKNGFRAAVIAAKLDPDFITPHALRHTAATWAMQAGVDVIKVAGMMGHKDTKMILAVYGHHHPKFMAGISDALRID